MRTYKASSAVILGLLLSSCSSVSEKQSEDPSASMEVTDSSVAPLEKAVFDYCFAPETMKSKVDDCSKLLTSLKTAQDQSATAVQQRYARIHAQFVDGKTRATELDEHGWGTRWMCGLVVLDVLSILVASAVFVAVLHSPQTGSIVREPSTPTDAGKVSFSRVIGLVGGISAFAFVGFITNVCLSHLFLTGKMPDQLGATYAAAVGTLLTALIPYVFNKSFSK
jgi:hypothetical protein